MKTILCFFFNKGCLSISNKLESQKLKKKKKNLLENDHNHNL